MIRFDYAWPSEVYKFSRWVWHTWRYPWCHGFRILGLEVEFYEMRYA